MTPQLRSNMDLYGCADPDGDCREDPMAPTPADRDQPSEETTVTGPAPPQQRWVATSRRNAAPESLQNPKSQEPQALPGGRGRPPCDCCPSYFTTAPPAQSPFDPYSAWNNCANQSGCYGTAPVPSSASLYPTMEAPQQHRPCPVSHRRGPSFGPGESKSAPPAKDWSGANTNSNTNNTSNKMNHASLAVDPSTQRKQTHPGGAGGHATIAAKPEGQEEITMCYNHMSSGVMNIHATFMLPSAQKEEPHFRAQGLTYQDGVRFGLGTMTVFTVWLALLKVSS